jgi:hypothetical protein
VRDVGESLLVDLSIIREEQKVGISTAVSARASEIPKRMKRKLRRVISGKNATFGSAPESKKYFGKVVI